MESQWHTLDISQVAQELETDVSNGLGKEEASSRLARYSPTFAYTKPSRAEPLIHRYVIIYLAILLLSSIALAIVGERTEAIAVFSFLIVSLLVILAVRYLSFRALEGIKIPERKAKLIREGDLIEAKVTAIVPGDLILLEGGDMVPADIRLVKAEGMKVDQRQIWPDNPVAEKRPDSCEADVPPSERFNMLYKGSFVLEGRGMGIVVAVGDDVAFPEESRTYGSYEEIGLQLIAHDISIKALLLALSIGLITFITLWILGRGFAYSLSFGSEFIVAFFPYLLSTLTMGVILYAFKRINREHGFMRRLSAMDEIDGITAICVEREWGITEDMYLIDMAFLDGRLMTRDEITKTVLVGGKEGERENEEEEEGDEEQQLSERELANDLRLLATAAYFSLSSYWNDGRPLPLLDEYSFDKELKGFCGELDLPLGGYLSGLEKISELNGEDGSFRAVVMRDPRGFCFTFISGTPQEMLNKCSHILVFGSQEGMDVEKKEALRTVAMHMEKEGLKVVAVAYGQPEEIEEGEYDPEKAEVGLMLVGLLGLRNPIRKGVAEAISLSREAGMRVMLMSDDDPEFAYELATNIGLIPSKTCSLTDEEIEGMTDQQLDEQIDRISLYLSLSPQNKEKVVRLLQSKGNRVGFITVDVEDLQPFKASDVKVTSLHRGSDLLVEESDVALSSGGLDGFAIVFSYVRSAFLGIYNTIRWLLSSHLGQGLALFVSFVLMSFWGDGFPMPMKLRQILWLNFWSLIIPSLGLIRDVKPVPARYTPSSRKEDITGGYKVDILLRGIVLALMALLGGVLTLEFSRYDESLTMRFRTTVTTLLLLAQLLFIFQCHRRYGEGLLRRFISNKALPALMMLAVAAHVIAIYFAPLANALGFSPIRVEWTWIGILCLIPLLPLSS
jgi:Ca2+-transporting ATPase